MKRILSRLQTKVRDLYPDPVDVSVDGFELLTLAEARSMLEVGRGKLYLLLWRRKIDGYMYGMRLLIPGSEVKRYNSYIREGGKLHGTTKNKR
jgi:excisionase family DNA binding protein